MGRLILARHGQASFLEHDYDKLSPTGEKQARMLGEYWARRNVAFHRVLSGPRVRQKDTAKIVGECYRKAGLRFPEPIVMPEFDEYASEAVLEKSLPGLIERNDEVRELNRAFVGSTNPGERQKNFQKMFETVIGSWVNGELAVPGVESWIEFCARVNRGLTELITDAHSGEEALVFSSGGPIAVAVQRALNLTARNTLGVLWMSRNCSYSEFLFSGDRFTLSSFNAFPHLDDPALLTYR